MAIVIEQKNLYYNYVISNYHLVKDEKARMIYEVREAEPRDQLTRIKCAEEKDGNEKSIKIVQNLLKMDLSIDEAVK